MVSTGGSGPGSPGWAQSVHPLAFFSQMTRLYWAPYKSTLLETLGLKMAHSELRVLLFLMALCRLCEALLSFLDFSDKKANTAIGLLTDLTLEER